MKLHNKITLLVLATPLIAPNILADTLKDNRDRLDSLSNSTKSDGSITLSEGLRNPKKLETHKLNTSGKEITKNETTLKHNPRVLSEAQKNIAQQLKNDDFDKGKIVKFDFRFKYGVNQLDLKGDNGDTEPYFALDFYSSREADFKAIRAHSVDKEGNFNPLFFMGNVFTSKAKDVYGGLFFHSEAVASATDNTTLAATTSIDLQFGIFKPFYDSTFTADSFLKDSKGRIGFFLEGEAQYFQDKEKVATDSRFVGRTGLRYAIKGCKELEEDTLHRHIRPNFYIDAGLNFYSDGKSSPKDGTPFVRIETPLIKNWRFYFDGTIDSSRGGDILEFGVYNTLDLSTLDDTISNILGID